MAAADACVASGRTRSTCGPSGCVPRGRGATQVLLPAALQPRRADFIEAIGTALHRRSLRPGKYPRIAAALGRSPFTVRRWLRRAFDSGLSHRALAARGARSPSGFMLRRSTSRPAPATCCGLYPAPVLAAAAEGARRRLSIA